MSYDKKIDDKEVAYAFSKEAYWDLILAKKLLQLIGPKSCDEDDEIFYLGRRTLYLLQQASEKAIKAYLLAYFKRLLEMLMLHNVEIDRSRRFPVRKVSKLIEETAKLINIGKISHEPIITVANVVCNLYELFFKNRYELREYIKFYITSGLRTIIDQGDENLIGAVAEVVMLSIFTQWYDINSLISLEFPQENKDRLDQVCSKLKDKDIKKAKLLESLVPPCITGNSILQIFRESYKKLMDEIKSQITSEQLYVKILSVLEKAYNNIKSQSNILISRRGGMFSIDELIEMYVKPFIEKVIQCLPNFISYLSFVIYIIPYLSIIDLCLALYERLGRYPGRVPETLETLDKDIREAICRDIRNLHDLVREVEYVVNEVVKSVEAIRELELCSQDVPLWNML
jgi:hypothetical protein